VIDKITLSHVFLQTLWISPAHYHSPSAQYSSIIGPLDVQGTLCHPISEKGGGGEQVVVVVVVVVVVMVVVVMMTGLYSGGTSFKSQPDYQLSYGFLWASSIFLQKWLENNLKYAVTISFKIITCS
jgi:hypothetical protein